MRLTIEGTSLIDCGGTIADLGKEEYSRRYHEKSVLAHAKLGQLEDIEEELGIDLTTLFKALKKGVYFENDKKHHVVALDLGSSGNYRLSYEITDGLFESVYTKDYGKTWALTKEELE